MFFLCVKYYCTANEQKHITHVYDTEQFPFLIEALKMPLWCKFVCLYVALISNSIPIRAALAMAFAVQRCLWFYSFLLLKYGSKWIVLVWGLIWTLITLKCGCPNLKAAARDTAAGWNICRVKQVCKGEECSQFTDSLTPGQPPANGFTLLFIAEEALNHNQLWQTAPSGAEKTTPVTLSCCRNSTWVHYSWQEQEGDRKCWTVWLHIFHIRVTCNCTFYHRYTHLGLPRSVVTSLLSIYAVQPNIVQKHQTLS